MYERTIAGEHRIYQITVTVTPTLIVDLLSGPDKVDYENLLNTGSLQQPFGYASISNAKNIPRVPIDGYIVCPTAILNISSDYASGAIENVPTNERYTNPIYFWPHKVLVSSSGPVTATVRIFFS